MNTSPRRVRSYSDATQPSTYVSRALPYCDDENYTFFYKNAGSYAKLPHAFILLCDGKFKPTNLYDMNLLYMMSGETVLGFIAFITYDPIPLFNFFQNYIFIEYICARNALCKGAGTLMLRELRHYGDDHQYSGIIAHSIPDVIPFYRTNGFSTIPGYSHFMYLPFRPLSGEDKMFVESIALRDKDEDEKWF